ncbi:hypothetical protein POM88_016867 [Heracleum sosnowskyi]|uniref:GRF-type domain-containing protein n=1 Tax=Heracleum sosnowskyi TaxID=360622 RepID=A0AAD8IMG8_9APIA|nr:hypothetical protein POM88_016867 [Heracleum sosnowskyi]
MANMCYCRKRAAQQMAWTTTNASRRFLACPDRCCNYFRWIDSPLCPRAQVIIPGLIRRINALEAQQRTGGDIMTGAEEEEVDVVDKRKCCNKTMSLLIFTWICIFFYVVSF